MPPGNGPPTTTKPASPPATDSQQPASPPPASAQPITLSPEERLSAIAQQRDVLIAMLQEDIQLRIASANASSDEQLPRLEQQLRLLYAAADRPDAATRAIDSLQPAQREAYKHLMSGLNAWLADHPSSRGSIQAAQLLHSLHEASTELAAISKLELRNLAFCERVESFGWFTPFARNEFQPKQQVILYVEVDHFSAIERGPHSFETELQGHYQIFDSRGQIVAERQLPLDREVCRNRRRDYFLAYPIYLPEAIEPGRYRLELTVEDLKAGEQYQGRKLGVASVEFVVRS
ncbi:MAG: hypothetical protein L0211_01525 [Planctomycetaceae bacterium]|nr:hypothetical protein [Planctomycetaceae bacterium]